MHEANSFVAQLLVTHLLYTVQDLFSTARQSGFQNSFHTLLFFFSVDQVIASLIMTEEETLWMKPTPSPVTVQVEFGTARRSSIR